MEKLSERPNTRARVYTSASELRREREKESEKKREREREAGRDGGINVKREINKELGGYMSTEWDKEREKEGFVKRVR